MEQFETIIELSTDGTSVVVGAEDAVLEPGVHLGYTSARGIQRALTVGSGAHIRSNSVIYSASSIGRRLATGHNVVIREECEIGDDVSIWSNTVVDYGCQIGNNVKIHSNCYVAQFTIIDDGAFLAPGVTVANDLYPGDKESEALMAGPHIGAGAQIGAGVTLLPYVKVGEEALIGAGAVVTKDVPAGMVAYGNPAAYSKKVADLQPISQRARRSK